jgi:predicted MFS family arabinose efflux permease
MTTPLKQSVIMGIVVEDERGVASGMSSAVWSLPNTLSSFVGGYLMALGFLAAPNFLSVIFYVVSISLFWYFFRNIPEPKGRPCPKTLQTEKTGKTPICQV